MGYDMLLQEASIVNWETEGGYIDDVVETWPHGFFVIFRSYTGMF